MPTLVFDGDCGFCRRCVALIARLGLNAEHVVPYQSADLPALGLTRAQCAAALQWVDDRGRADAGHRAVARLLLHSALPYRVLGVLLLTPPLSWLAAGVYALVAAHRGRF